MLVCQVKVVDEQRQPCTNLTSPVVIGGAAGAPVPSPRLRLRLRLRLWSSTLAPAPAAPAAPRAASCAGAVSVPVGLPVLGSAVRALLCALRQVGEVKGLSPLESAPSLHGAHETQLRIDLRVELRISPLLLAAPARRSLARSLAHRRMAEQRYDVLERGKHVVAAQLRAQAAR